MLITLITLITSYHIYESLLSPESNKPNPWYTTEEGYHRTVSKYLSEHPDIDMLGLYEICGNPKTNPFSTSCARWFRKIMKNKLK